MPPGLSALLLTSDTVTPNNYSLFSGFVHLGAGLACGFTGLAAGYAIGLVGDAVRYFVTPRHGGSDSCFSVFVHTFTNRKYSSEWFSY